MGFSLTVTQGEDRGRQYTFDQPEVNIGRTPDNDLVFTSPGVSRRHVTIRAEAGRFLIEDRGSSNGTQVNGKSIRQVELKKGDAVTLGPVVLSFQPLDGATSPRAAPRAPAAAQGKAVEARRKTQALPAAASRSLAVPSPAQPAARPPPVAMSASERARFLREHKGALGKLQLAMKTRPALSKGLAFGALGVLLLGVGLAAWLFGRGGQDAIGMADRSRNRFPLTDRSGPDVYGYGDFFSVTVQTRDELHLEFEYSDALPVVLYLRFESQGVERPDEVDISLNGVRIANVGGGLGDFGREQRIKLPKKHLKPGLPNEIVFDNALNPPGREPWAISKLRLESKPLPTGSRTEMLKCAKDSYDFAEQRMSMKDFAAENRYEAWSSLHKALLCLESVEPKPDLYNVVQQSLREVDRELDATCSKIMLSAKRAEELNDPERAIREYKHGLQWFPKEDHACRISLMQKLDEYGEPVP